MDPLVSAPMGRIGLPAVIVALPALTRILKFDVRVAKKLVIFALPAVLLSRKKTKPPVPASSALPATPELIVALPAVLLPRKGYGTCIESVDSRRASRARNFE